MFNREFNVIRELTPTPANPAPYNADTGPWQKFQEDVMSLIYPAITLRTAGVQSDYIKKLNATRARILTEELPQGTLVVLKDERYLKGAHKPSFNPRYRGNVYSVVACTANGAYVLEDSVDHQLLDRRVTLDMMKVIRGPKYTRTSVPEDGDDDNWTVKKIIGHRDDPNKPGDYEYLVWW